MQDSYIGDIGDYGKYGLLREVCNTPISLSVNWYKVTPSKIGKQDDGKYINYLHSPSVYGEYDNSLFNSLYKIVITEQDRRIERIEQENLFSSIYYSEPLCSSRNLWHAQALHKTKGTDVVFLDPDNGLETSMMYKNNRSTEKHVKWEELRDYYNRGQSVIMYQHRPQMCKKEKCIENVMNFNNTYLCADYVKLLEFPKFTNRFYFMFIHKNHITTFDNICNAMTNKWGKNNFCREIPLQNGKTL